MKEEQKLMLSYINENNMKELKKQIRDGVSPNFFSGDEVLKTPLHYAVSNRNINMIVLLIDEGKALVDDSVIALCDVFNNKIDFQIACYLAGVLPK